MWHIQGNIGVGEAIAYFTRHGYVVSIPLNDTQYYDIIVEKDGIIETVQVKTTSYEKDGFSRVTVKSSTVTQGGTKHYKYLNDKLSIIFVHDLINNKNYLVRDFTSLPKTQWKLDDKFDAYLV